MMLSLLMVARVARVDGTPAATTAPSRGPTSRNSAVVVLGLE